VVQSYQKKEKTVTADQEKRGHFEEVFWGGGTYKGRLLWGKLDDIQGIERQWKGAHAYMYMAKNEVIEIQDDELWRNGKKKGETYGTTGLLGTFCRRIIEDHYTKQFIQ